MTDVELAGLANGAHAEVEAAVNHAPAEASALSEGTTSAQAVPLERGGSLKWQAQSRATGSRASGSASRARGRRSQPTPPSVRRPKVG